MEEYIFEVYYNGTLLGTCKTDERHKLITEHLTQDEINNMKPGSIEFRLVAFQ